MLANDTGVPVVASNDVRFIERDDFEAHEARVCIHDGRSLSDPDRPRLYSDQQYLRSSADMQALFADIDLGAVSTSMTINGPANILMAMYIATAEAGGVERGALGGTIQNDILKEYVARGTYIFPPDPSVRLAADTMAY